jgi:hypothetical protein
MRKTLRVVLNVIKSIFALVSIVLILGSADTESLDVMEMISVFSVGMIFLLMTIELQLFINSRL